MGRRLASQKSYVEQYDRVFGKTGEDTITTADDVHFAHWNSNQYFPKVFYTMVGVKIPIMVDNVVSVTLI